jgi:hypothetical protein
MRLKVHLEIVTIGGVSSLFRLSSRDERAGSLRHTSRSWRLQRQLPDESGAYVKLLVSLTHTR